MNRLLNIPRILFTFLLLISNTINAQESIKSYFIPQIINNPSIFAYKNEKGQIIPGAFREISYQQRASGWLVVTTEYQNGRLLHQARQQILIEESEVSIQSEETIDALGNITQTSYSPTPSTLLLIPSKGSVSSITRESGDGTTTVIVFKISTLTVNNQRKNILIKAEQVITRSSGNLKKFPLTKEYYVQGLGLWKYEIDGKEMLLLQ